MDEDYNAGDNVDGVGVLDVTTHRLVPPIRSARFSRLQRS
jgi:hypothetical protein